MPQNTKFDPENINFFNKTKLFKDCKGASGVAVAGQTTNLDLTLSDDVLMTGGVFLAQNAAQGDKVDFQVLAPDGQGGYVVVAQFITDWYLDPTVVQQPIPRSSYPAKLVAGLILRVIYHSVGENNVWMAVNYDREKVLE
jgi:hypothetical protein